MLGGGKTEGAMSIGTYSVVETAVPDGYDLDAIKRVLTYDGSVITSAHFVTSVIFYSCLNVRVSAFLSAAKYDMMSYHTAKEEG